MAKFFDIRPPKPKPAPAAAPRRRKNSWGWFLVLVLLIIIAIFAWQVPTKLTSNGTKKSTETSPAKNNFELFDQTGQSNLTQEKAIIVRILNASGADAPAETAKKLLTDGGLKIEQTGPSVNLYEQTIIYYKKDQLAQGQKVDSLLKTQFQTKLQESENLGSTYDVLVIVGQK